ncbi:MAG: hypothetical protein E7500_10065 [Ruminococcus sp.]|nr:hypothetical protein [Ruminococcus sp.]
MVPSIHSGHRGRMRSRALDTEFNGFSQHEILELLLFYALPRVNTNNLAHTLINKFGSLSAVLDAPASQLAQIQGLSLSSASFLKLIGELCDIYSSSEPDNIKFTSTAELKQFFIDYFKSNDADICLVISVDSDFRLTALRSFPTALLTDNSVAPKQLITTILGCKMERIVIGQNHPGKLPIPNESDYTITKLFSELVAPLRIELCDHIICGSNHAFSMREKSAFSFFNGASL